MGPNDLAVLGRKGHQLRPVISQGVSHAGDLLRGGPSSPKMQNTFPEDPRPEN